MHGVGARLVPATRPVCLRSMPHAPAANGGTHMHETNRVTVLIRFGAGDSRDGDHHVRRTAVEGARRHGFGHGSACRGVWAAISSRGTASVAIL
jgi:hypothetical protein